MITRKDILELADKCVNGDRDNQYGSPENNFANVAKLWRVYLDHPGLDAHDVAMMMVLFKVARSMTGNQLDNYVDICGYAACGGEILGNIAGWSKEENPSNK